LKSNRRAARNGNRQDRTKEGEDACREARWTGGRHEGTGKAGRNRTQLELTENRQKGTGHGRIRNDA
jgi:hypothetical protein